MGINGLLQALKPIAKQSHVRQYKGQRVAIDGYSWLHKGAYCCSRELCEGIWTDKFVVYFMSRIQLLRTNGLEPIVVFDGGRLPIKGEEEESRHRARAEARAKAAAHLAAGNVSMAQECYQRCVDVTPAMAKQVIEALKSEGVRFVVAPYEADAQMAYLARSGQVQLVVTEDSDLLAYGCPRVLYKLDKTGTGEEISLADLPNCPSLPLSGWTADQFLQLCVMAGCDFLAQLPGIGLKKAHGVLRKYRSFTKVVKMLRFNGTRVPPDYDVRFQLALWAFRHARVYCTKQKAMIHLAPLPGGGIGAADVDVPAAVTQLEQQQQDQQLDFLGPLLSPEVARGIAEGDLDPSTHKPYDLAAIYAGCSAPPAHLAAQLAKLQPIPDPGGGASQGLCASQAAAAVSGGPAAKPKVGLSKRHAGLSGGASRCMSVVSTAGAAGAVSGGGQASGGAKKRSSLGIAKYFQKPLLAAAAGTGAGAAATAAVPAAETAAPAGQSIKQSIAMAMNTLGQQLQQRQQLQQADKEQVLHELTQQRQLQQQQQDSQAELGDDVPVLPPAKRHCSTGDLAIAADSEDVAAAITNAGQGDAEQSMPSLPASLPHSSSSLGLSDRSGSPALDASMSLGLSSAGLMAGGASGGAAARPSQHGPHSMCGSDPSFLCGSSDGSGSQPRPGKGAAVSALSALLASTTAAPAGGGMRYSSSGVDPCWGSSQLQTDAGAGRLGTSDGVSWDLPGSSGGGGYFSQPAECGGSSGLLGSGSSGNDLGCSLGGCGSSSGLSLGVPGGSGGITGAAVLAGTASMSFEEADGVDEELDAAAGIGSNTNLRRLQQCLNTGFKQPRQHQQAAAAGDPTKSSFFSQQQPLLPGSAPSNTLGSTLGNKLGSTQRRRHSRFKEQLLRDADTHAADLDSLQDLATGTGVLQDSPDLDILGLQDTRQPARQQQQQQHVSGTSDEQQHVAGGQNPTQRQQAHTQQLQPALQMSDSSEHSSGSGTTSNDENVEGAAALEHLGIGHVRHFAKLAHKAVKTVAKQQQHAPLAPRTTLLNTQQPVELQQQQQHFVASQGAGGLATAAAGATAGNRARPQLGLSKGGLAGGRTAGKGRAVGSGTGSFAAKLAGLRYDASMFVPLDQQQRQQSNDEDEDTLAGLALPSSTGRQGGMFGRSNTAAAARKPFKAPWAAAAATAAAETDSPSLSDLLQSEEPGADARDAAAGFGAFGDFACGVAGRANRVGGTQQAKGRKRGAVFGLR